MHGELICEYGPLCTYPPKYVWTGHFNGPIPICAFQRNFLINLGKPESEFISLNHGEIDGMPAREWLEAMRME